MFKNNFEKLLFVLLAIIGISLTLHINSALAEWQNPMQGPDWCRECVPIHWSEMGSFDNNGVWQWDQNFRHSATAPDGNPVITPEGNPIGICQWGPANPCNDEELWRPRKEVGINETRMMLKRFPDAPARTELALNAGLSIRYPEVWWTPPNSDHNGANHWMWVGNFQPPEGCSEESPYMGDVNLCAQHFSQYAIEEWWQQDNFCHTDGTIGDGTPICVDISLDSCTPENGVLDSHEFDCRQMGPAPVVHWDPFNPEMNADENVDPCCKASRDLFFISENIEPLTKDRINSVTWNGELMQYKNCMTEAYWRTVNYDLWWVNNFWIDSNRWRTAETSGYGPEVRFKSDILPVVGDQNFVVTYDVDKILEFTIFADNVEPMPMVPVEVTQTTTEYVLANDNDGQQKKMQSGKAVKLTPVDGEVATVRNIKTRFLDNGALVIQWPEPDGALMGGMQLRLYFGTDYTVLPGDECETEVFLWMNSPAQIGTVVIDKPVFDELVAKIREIHPTTTQIMGVFMYRTDSESWPLVFHNRGYSGKFFIPMP